MKAIHIDRFVSNVTDLKPSTIPNPFSKSSQDIHIKITHAAVTHVDLLYAQGLHQNNRRHVQPPFILGTEYAGITTHSPPSSSFPPGTRVFGGGLGTYAEQICVSEPSIRRVPSQWTNAEACAVGASGARFGEDGRRDPQRTQDVWDGFMKLVEDGKIRPVIYKEDYWGLEAVSRALEDVRERKAWGRAVIRVCEVEEDKTEQKARL
ncbi:uncharacterized protein J4E84_003143 [Alternaria hordeiaustralica]|uniref:uncharacterized protein n=1 Tax=Alternaria hordeiaustralica TaxID=1187925 RepID=UPI0020C4F06A|nr:uncharacterized protein J4E84_003143 [Alternaria hordeiaustralica]KAI4692175.1 hypothetical protein J4E84_003143 [Alternaria hordeiaustralica]